MPAYVLVVLLSKSCSCHAPQQKSHIFAIHKRFLFMQFVEDLAFLFTTIFFMPCNKKLIVLIVAKTPLLEKCCFLSKAQHSLTKALHCYLLISFYVDCLT
uniref:Uncharacterized protein n=1 Tax=Ixodes scapularis TaxID=6945 RepID=A0A4D5RYJ8_IXOSC